MHKLIFIVSVFFMLFNASALNAQCDQAFIDNCASIPQAKYIKHFRIRFTEASGDKKSSQGSFTMMLNKGNHYRFSVCNDPSKPGSTIIELSSDFGSFGGNHNASNNTEYKAFDFLCTKTGPYYLKMYFKDGKEGCGVCIVSLIMD